MPSHNRVQLIGNTGKDAEARFTTSGKKVATFSVAVNHRWKNSEGELQEEMEWFRVKTWGWLADICDKYLKKGRLVFVEGRLHTDKYEQDGVTRYSTEVIADTVQFLDRKPDEDAGEGEFMSEADAADF
jgi:single-strand DNA-binding protein